MTDESNGASDEHAGTPAPPQPHAPMPRPETMTPRAPLGPGAGIRMYPTMPPPVSTVPAQWAADPGGAHQWRWWDGVRWTEQVADDGVTSIDPLPPA